VSAVGPEPGKERLRRRVVRAAVPPLAALLIRALRRSLRLRAHRREVVERFAAEDRRYIHVFWHAHLLLMVYSYVGPRLEFLISRHRDGELIARTVARFGYVPVRGSTSRGGAMALRRLLRSLERGADIGFTPDGPRGPARRVQPGAVAAARLSGAPIVPVSFAAERAWELATWDRFLIPKPGTRALIAYGEPLFVSRDEPLASAAGRLQRALDELERFARTHAADPAVGRPL